MARTKNPNKINPAIRILLQKFVFYKYNRDKGHPSFSLTSIEKNELSTKLKITQGFVNMWQKSTNLQVLDTFSNFDILVKFLSLQEVKNIHSFQNLYLNQPFVKKYEKKKIENYFEFDDGDLEKINNWAIEIVNNHYNGNSLIKESKMHEEISIPNRIQKISINQQITTDLGSFIDVEKDYSNKIFEYINDDFWDKYRLIDEEKLLDLDRKYFLLNDKSRTVEIIANNRFVEYEDLIECTFYPENSSKKFTIKNLVNEALNNDFSIVSINADGGSGKTNFINQFAYNFYLQFHVLKFIYDDAEDNIEIYLPTIKDNKPLIFIIDNIASHSYKLKDYIKTISNKYRNINKVVLLLSERKDRYDIIRKLEDFQYPIFDVNFKYSNEVQLSIFKKTIEVIRGDGLQIEENLENKMNELFLNNIQDNHLTLLENIVFVCRKNKIGGKLDLRTEEQDWQMINKRLNLNLPNLYLQIAFFYQFGIKVPIDFIKDSELRNKLLANMQDYGIKFDSEHYPKYMSLRNEKKAELLFKIEKYQQQGQQFLEEFLNHIETPTDVFLLRKLCDIRNSVLKESFWEKQFDFQKKKSALEDAVKISFSDEVDLYKTQIILSGYLDGLQQIEILEKIIDSNQKDYHARTKLAGILSIISHNETDKLKQEEINKKILDLYLKVHENEGPNLFISSQIVLFYKYLRDVDGRKSFLERLKSESINWGTYENIWYIEACIEQAENESDLIEIIDLIHEMEFENSNSNDFKLLKAKFEIKRERFSKAREIIDSIKLDNLDKLININCSIWVIVSYAQEGNYLTTFWNSIDFFKEHGINKIVWSCFERSMNRINYIEKYKLKEKIEHSIEINFFKNETEILERLGNYFYKKLPSKNPIIGINNLKDLELSKFYYEMALKKNSKNTSNIKLLTKLIWVLKLSNSPKHEIEQLYQAIIKLDPWNFKNYQFYYRYLMGNKEYELAQQVLNDFYFFKN